MNRKPLFVARIGPLSEQQLLGRLKCSRYDLGYATGRALLRKFGSLPDQYKHSTGAHHFARRNWRAVKAELDRMRMA